MRLNQAKKLFRAGVLKMALLMIILSPVTSHAAELNTSLVPNDPGFRNQEYLSRIRAQQAWDIVFNHTLKKDVVIAVLDTGVDITHPDLEGQIWRNPNEVANDRIDNDGNTYIDDIVGWDFIESSADPTPKLNVDNPDENSIEAYHHGTVVAGVLSATLNNGIGVAGASYNAKIMPLRVLDSTGSGSTLLLAQAIDYAVENGADIINLSLVGEERDERLVKSIERAYREGVAIVAASGNRDAGGIDLDASPRYPVCDETGVNRVLGVAALDEYNRLAPFSNYGQSCIDISAPGTNFYSTVSTLDTEASLESIYTSGWSGTSVAAPLVSSALALVKRVAPTLTLEAAYETVLNNATSVRAANQNFEDLGVGMLNLESALDAALNITRVGERFFVLGSGPGFAPEVQIISESGGLVRKFLAYDSGFRGGINIAVGDIDGDGVEEIVTAPRTGGGPHVRIFSQDGVLLKQFMAYRPEFFGGVSVAIGDMNGNGLGEIVTAPMGGGGPHLRMFTPDGEIVNQFMAYAPTFEGGLTMAVGDLDADGIGELITAPASQGGPHIRIFTREGELKGQFMAFDPEYRGGLTFAIGNVDGVRGNEIIVAQSIANGAEVRIFNSLAQEKNRFSVFSASDTPEVIQLAAADTTGDQRDEILISPRSQTDEVRSTDFYGATLSVRSLPAQTNQNFSLYFVD